jgi:hypothetical protein
MFPWLAFAQTQTITGQQNAVREIGSESSSRPASGDDSLNAGTSSEPSGASTWSAGRGSFGKVRATSGAGNLSERKAGSAVVPSLGSSSWEAGRGEFGSSAQQRGIWKERAGTSQISGSRLATHPGLKVNPSAFTPKRTTPTQFVAAGTPTRTPIGGGMHFGPSNGGLGTSHGNISHRARTSSPAVHRGRTIAQRRSGLGPGKGTKFHATRTASQPLFAAPRPLSQRQSNAFPVGAPQNAPQP